MKYVENWEKKNQLKPILISNERNSIGNVNYYFYRYE